MRKKHAPRPLPSNDLWAASHGQSVRTSVAGAKKKKEESNKKAKTDAVGKKPTIVRKGTWKE